jgi:hypothetical protein
MGYPEQIKTFFNHNSYLIDSPSFVSKVEIDTEGLDPYIGAWYVFGRMMQSLSSLDEINELVVHHDTRIIEELRNEISPLNDYGSACRRYFLLYDRSKINTFRTTKVSTKQISRAIEEAHSAGIRHKKTTESSSKDRPV